MPDKSQETPSCPDKSQETSSCGCAHTEGAPSCPCDKRICMAVFGLLGLALVASMATSRKKRP